LLGLVNSSIWAYSVTVVLTKYSQFFDKTPHAFISRLTGMKF